nr:MAG TPA: hypothetical protein [Caudoviricetes sp.]
MKGSNLSRYGLVLPYTLGDYSQLANLETLRLIDLFVD